MTCVRARQTSHTLDRGVHHVRRPKSSRSVVERDERGEDTLQDPVVEGSVQDRNKRRRQKKLLAGIGPCTTPPSVRLVGRPKGSREAAPAPGTAPLPREISRHRGLRLAFGARWSSPSTRFWPLLRHMPPFATCSALFAVCLWRWVALTGRIQSREANS